MLKIDATENRPTELQFDLAFGLLKTLVDDPFPRKRQARGKPSTESARETEFRSRQSAVQRPFAGAKRTNVIAFARYLAEASRGERDQVTQPIHLWSPAPLSIVERRGGAQVVIDGEEIHAAIAVAIDGETQLAARFKNWREHEIGTFDQVHVVCHHGITELQAQQKFHDLNAHQVRVSVALAASRDHHDVVTQAAKTLVPLLGDQISNNGDSTRLSLVTLQQAVRWAAFHKLTTPRRCPTLAADLDRAIEHLRERLIVLRPLVRDHAVLRKAVVFIAATDTRVGPLNLDEAAWDNDSPYKTDVKPARIEAWVQLLRGETLGLSSEGVASAPTVN